MKMIRLVDILTDDQCKRVEKILKKHPLQVDAVSELKKFYSNMYQYLEDQGIDPHYLAYVTVYIANGGEDGDADSMVEHFKKLASSPEPIIKRRRKKGTK